MSEPSAVEKLLAEHRPVIEAGAWARVVGCQCMDRVFVNGQESYPAHLAEVLRGDGLVETVAEAIWQANTELTKPEHRNMPDGEARTYFARAALAAIFGSSDE